MCLALGTTACVTEQDRQLQPAPRSERSSTSDESDVLRAVGADIVATPLPGTHAHDRGQPTDATARDAAQPEQTPPLTQPEASTTSVPELEPTGDAAPEAGPHPSTQPACTQDSDCESGTCVLVLGVCLMGDCTDGRRSAGESDVDCGGDTACPRCEVGQRCEEGSDCASSTCSPYGEQCVLEPPELMDEMPPTGSDSQPQSPLDIARRLADSGVTEPTDTGVVD